MRLALSILALAVAAMVAAAADPKPAPSRIVGVIVYQMTALVTREVAVPEAAGSLEVVVGPLPPSTMGTSLYAEGSEGVRILSVRYRTRAIAEDTREEVRKLEAKVKDFTRKGQTMVNDLKIMEINAQFLNKLEGFTAATLVQLTQKGQLDSESTIALANFIKDGRTKLGKDEVAMRQAIDENKEEIDYANRQLEEARGGVVRTERDAVIVIDKAKAGAAAVRLNYLVNDASWKPQYKLRAGAKEGDKLMVEYLAAVSQQTGEDWGGVNLTLSTAQPLLNAAPPDLMTLEVAVGAPVAGAGELKKLAEQSKGLRGQGGANYLKNNPMDAAKDINGAAAIEQFSDLVIAREAIASDESPADSVLPSVTYYLKTKLSLPSRNDEQTLEIARLELAPKFYYKAVPVLTTAVYRIADLTNTTDHILLPGDATMYLGTDFVGQTKLPLVAVGKPFTVGFGVDPQLQIARKLIDRSRTTQGGNQVLKFNYRILLTSYKTAPVDVQVWDRMPHAEAQQTIAVTVTNTKPELSTEALYVRDDKPKNLLRWDVKLDPKQNGEKALGIDYEYRLELDKNVSIGAFQAK